MFVQLESAQMEAPLAATLPPPVEVIDTPAGPVEWLVSDRPVAYETALAAMEQRVAEIRAGTAREANWLLGHSALYTPGTSAREGELLDRSEGRRVGEECGRTCSLWGSALH